MSIVLGFALSIDFIIGFDDTKSIELCFDVMLVLCERQMFETKLVVVDSFQDTQKAILLEKILAVVVFNVGWSAFRPV